MGIVCLIFLLPVTTIDVLYLRSILWLQRTFFGQETIENLDNTSRSRFVKDNQRILCIMCVILAALVVLVGPNHIVWLDYNHSGVENVSFETQRKLLVVYDIMYAFHTTGNPFIYNIPSKFSGDIQ